MRINHLKNIPLIMLLSFMAGGVVSAKPASGLQNLSSDLHQAQSVANALMHQAKTDISTIFMSGSSVVPKNTGKALRPVGSVLESIDDVLTNPNLLAGKSPAQIQAIIGKTPGWKIETLGKGSKKGQGWVFRQYNDRGQATGQSLRWHPGGGHHGPDPYWRVTSNVVGKSGIIR